MLKHRSWMVASNAEVPLAARAATQAALLRGACPLRCAALQAELDTRELSFVRDFMQLMAKARFSLLTQVRGRGRCPACASHNITAQHRTAHCSAVQY